MEAQYESKSNRTATLVLLLALLLHCIFLIYLHKMQHYDQSYELKLQKLREEAAKIAQNQQQQNPQEESVEWFSGDARPSPAPVIFHEEPSAPKPQIEKSEIIESKALTEAMENITKPEEIAPEEIEKKIEEIAQELQELKTTIEQKIAEQPVKKTDSKKQNTPPETNKNHREENKTPEINQTQSQKISLADIAQGLMSKFNENSQHIVASKGGKLGQPTEEQLRYERYIGKLFACMQKSIRIHKNSLKLDAFHEVEVYFQVTLNRKGILEDVHIISSSGIPALDNFMLFIVRDASSSFPPVPAAIKQTSYPLGFVINPGPNRAGINFSYI